MKSCNVLAIVILLLLTLAALYVGFSHHTATIHTYGGQITDEQALANNVARTAQILESILHLATIFVVMLGIFLAFMVHKKK